MALSQNRFNNEHSSLERSAILIGNPSVAMLLTVWGPAWAGPHPLIDFQRDFSGLYTGVMLQ